MDIAVLGTGEVGSTIGSKLVDLGHRVTMGSRTAGNDKAVGWAKAAGGSAAEGSFADAAATGELIFNCTAGTVSLDALQLAGAANLDGKVLVDVANPLDFSQGMPPILSVCNTDSLGEQIQRAFPAARVVKSLNTMTARVMVDPAKLGGDHLVFVCGDDAAAKETTAALLESFGWPRPRIRDLGGIIAARACEMVLPLWLRLAMSAGTSEFNFAIAR